MQIVEKKQEQSPKKEDKDRKRKYNEKNADGNTEKREKKQKPVNNEHHEKKERPQKPERAEREKIKSQYEYNADLITETTEIPPLPKKNEELKKPERDDFKERETKIRTKINNFKQDIKKIRAQKFNGAKKTNKGQNNNFGQFKQQIDDIQQLRDLLKELKLSRNTMRDKWSKLIDESKANNNLIKNLRALNKNSRETIEEQLHELQQQLMTADISKQQERQLHNDIMLKKRTLKDAESSQNLEVKLARAQDRKEELDEQIATLKAEKDPVEEECKQISKKIDDKNAAIDKLKGVISTEKTEKSKAQQVHDKQYEDWKEGKKKRQDQIYQKIKKLEEQIDKIWDEYGIQRQAYWKQKHYLDFIKWQTKVRDRKINDRLRQQRRKEYEEKQKEREKQQNKQKYIGQIELCSFLINYCKSLYPQQHKKQGQQKKQEVDIQKKLTQDKEWKKQKGLEILQSKKNKQDEQPKKKGKKGNKKNKQESQNKQQKFDVPFNMQIQFEKLKVLAPESVEDIERAIKQLNEREQLFQRACVENPSEEDQTKIAELKETKKTKKEHNKQSKEEDFPTL